VNGIEITAYAAELVRVSVWVGAIQWMRRNGFSNTTDPILDPHETIECRGAILAKDSGQASSDRSTEVARHRNRQNDSFHLPPLCLSSTPRLGPSPDWTTLYPEQIGERRSMPIGSSYPVHEDSILDFRPASALPCVPSTVRDKSHIPRAPQA